MSFIDEVNNANRREMPAKANLEDIAKEIYDCVKKKFLNHPKEVSEVKLFIKQTRFEVYVSCRIYGFNEREDYIHPASTHIYYDDGNIHTVFFESLNAYRKVYNIVSCLCKDDGIKAIDTKHHSMLFSVPKKG